MGQISRYHRDESEQGKKNPTLDDCNCGFGKACSRIFVQQPLDGRMLSLLIWVPVLGFTQLGFCSGFFLSGAGSWGRHKGLGVHSAFFCDVLGKH